MLGGGSYSSAEIQLVYSSAPTADKKIKLEKVTTLNKKAYRKISPILMGSVLVV